MSVKEMSTIEIDSIGNSCLRAASWRKL